MSNKKFHVGPCAQRHLGRQRSLFLFLGVVLYLKTHTPIITKLGLDHNWRTSKFSRKYVKVKGNFRLKGALSCFLFKTLLLLEETVLLLEVISDRDDINIC